MRNYAFKNKRRINAARWVDRLGYLFRRPLSYKELNPRRLLVIRLDQMGDVVQTLPALKALRHSYPKARIDCLTTSLGQQIIQATGLADRFFVWNCAWFDPGRPAGVPFLKLARWVKEGAYDVALELRGDARLIFLLRLLGVKNIVGYGCTGGGFLLDVDVPWNSQMHAVDKSLKLVEAIGAQAAGDEPDLASKYSRPSTVGAPGGNRFRLAVHPDAGASAKRWPVENFIRLLARLLLDASVEVDIIGSNSLIGEAFETELEGRVRNHMGKTTLPQLIDLLAQCDGLITNDSGPAHVMAALGKPVWILWSGTADPTVWTPRGKGDVFLFQNAVACAPCSLANCPIEGHPCMTGISVERVWQSLNSFLRSLKRCEV